MTISGNITLNDLHSHLELIPANKSQKYISNIEHKLKAIDGGQIHLVHDLETGTSDVIVGEFIEAILFETSYQELPIFQLIQLCFKQNIYFRFWWASNDLDDFNKAIKVNDMSGIINTIKEHEGVYWHAC